MVHGVAVIHGIGEGQERGEFLASVFNGIADGLEESGATVVRRFHTDGEATAGLTVTPPQGKPGGPQGFEFVEAFWADAFPPPAASTVASWLFKQGPGQIKAIGTGLFKDPGNDSSFDPDHQPGPDTPAIPAFVQLIYRFELAILLAAGGLLWLVAIPLIPVLWFLSWIPRTPLLNPFGIFTRVLDGVHALDPFLSKSLGDTERYVQNGAWAANVRGILEGILVGFAGRKEVTDITIIAHSQGAAIAYDALAQGSPVAAALATSPKRLTLVTLGSGVNQVFALAKKSNTYARKRFSLPLDPDVTGKSKVVPEELPKRFYWLDLYARLDPVPAGGLKPWIQTQAGVADSQVKRRRVVNLDNPLRDHSAYFVNKDVVVPRLVRAIYGGEYPWPEAGVTRERVLRRASGVAWLQLAGLIILGLVVAQSALLAWNNSWRIEIVGKLEPAVLRTPGFKSLYCQLSNGTLHARPHQSINSQLAGLSGAAREQKIEALDLKEPLKACVAQSNFLGRDLGLVFLTLLVMGVTVTLGVGSYRLLGDRLFGDLS